MRMKEGELTFQFDGAVRVEKLDEENKSKPQGMSLVDFVVEEEERTLLIEVKDPSDVKAHEKERTAFSHKLRGDEYISGKLVPKARDSYTYLHLMKRDSKEFLYVVVLGIEAVPVDKALLSGFKDRLLGRIRKEADLPWRRHYVRDCIVVTVSQWNNNRHLKKYPLLRER